FSFSNIMPGTYLLTASDESPVMQSASAAIEVAGVDRSGLQLVLRPAPTVSGRLVFEGASVPPVLAGFRLPVRSLSTSSVENAPKISPASAQGTWTWTGVLPGRYVVGGPLYLGPNAESMKWALQSVTVDGRDMTDLPLDIATNTAPSEIIVRYS